MLNEEALGVLKPFARQFIFCFDSKTNKPQSRFPLCSLDVPRTDYFHGILRDIRMGRSKIRETDNLRVLFLCRFFMEYFLALRQEQKEQIAQKLKTKELTRRQAEKSRDPFGGLGLGDDIALMAELDKEPTRRAGEPAAETEESNNEVLDFRLLAEVFQDDTRGWLGRRLGEAKDAKVGFLRVD